MAMTANTSKMLARAAEKTHTYTCREREREREIQITTIIMHKLVNQSNDATGEHFEHAMEMERTHYTH
jgi:hypothetical protein